MAGVAAPLLRWMAMLNRTESPLSLALCVAYPLVLLPLGFYQPAELARLRRLAPGW